MRIILLLLMIAFMANTGLSQPPVKEIKKPVPEQVPSKNQIRAEMVSAINEINTQIAYLEKQIAEALNISGHGKK